MSAINRREALKKVAVVGTAAAAAGAVLAAVVADTVDPGSGKPSKYVIGMQRPSPRSFWKIPWMPGQKRLLLSWKPGANA